MNTEKTITHDMELGSDLYDGMILETLSTGPTYLSSLDMYSIKNIKDRLESYKKILMGSDENKKQQMFDVLNMHISLDTLKSVLDHVNFILTKVERNFDDVDTLIVNILKDNRDLLNEIDDNTVLNSIKKRLTVYYSMISGNNPDIKKELFDRLGVYFSADLIKNMLDHIDILLSKYNIPD